MGIVGLIFAVGFLSVTSGSMERELREHSGSIEDAFRKARTLAQTQQRSYVVTLTPQGVKLEPLGVEVDQLYDARRTAPSRRRTDLTEEELAEQEDARWPDIREERTFDDEELKIQVQRWGAPRLVTLNSRTKNQRFVLEPTGLVEPALIRVTKGNSHIEFELSPLSGAARNEGMVIKE